MEAKLQLITPEIAKKYLAQNISNYRTMSNSVVAAYAADMKSGNWKLNGETIKFNKSNMLVDGQHRLAAVIKSGCSVLMMVLTGVPDEITTFDIGKNRTIVQIAKANDLNASVANNTTVGAVSMLMKGDKVSASSVPKQKIIEIISKEPQNWSNAYLAVARSKTNAIARKSPVVLAVYVLIKQGNSFDDLSQFFSVVNTGFPIDGVECSPAIVLRNYILSDKYKSEFHNNHGRTLLFSSTISAFNDFKAGSKRKMRYSTDPAHISLLGAMKHIAMEE